jgi:hypothetical protein
MQLTALLFIALLLIVEFSYRMLEIDLRPPFGRDHSDW